MGYSLSLLALKTPDANGSLADLHISKTGQVCEYARPSLSGCALPSGWYLIVANTCDHRIVEPTTLAKLSKNCPVVAASVEEHVMFSSAEQWIDGTRTWRAEHNGEHGPININTTGVLPPNFPEISSALIQEQQDDGGPQAGVDHYFDIPLQAAKAITGFKYDEEIAGIEYDRFELLLDIDAGSSKKPWWRFWTSDKA